MMTTMMTMTRAMNGTDGAYDKIVSRRYIVATHGLRIIALDAGYLKYANTIVSQNTAHAVL